MLQYKPPNPSRRTMAQGLTQPQTETSTRNISGGKGRPVARKGDNLTALLLAHCLENVGTSMSHSPIRLDSLLIGLALPFYLIAGELWADILGVWFVRAKVSRPIRNVLHKGMGNLTRKKEKCIAFKDISCLTSLVSAYAKNRIWLFYIGDVTRYTSLYCCDVPSAIFQTECSKSKAILVTGREGL
jgi:hypothetical protein